MMIPDFTFGSEKIRHSNFSYEECNYVKELVKRKCLFHQHFIFQSKDLETGDVEMSSVLLVGVVLEIQVQCEMVRRNLRA